MLDLKEITYQPQTGNKKILDDISFSINENEIILICGSSGSGKTTLLEIISGLTIPQKGKITWKNKILSSRERRCFCGVVFQFPFWGFVNPLIISIRVVFPEPLSPQIKIISFSYTFKLRLFNIFLSPVWG